MVVIGETALGIINGAEVLEDGVAVTKTTDGRDMLLGL